MRTVFPILLILALLAGCSGAPASAGELTGPDAVAANFFTAYIEQAAAGKSIFDDPEFQGVEALSEDFLHQAREIRAGFDGFGFDPVILAQNLPPLPVRVVESEMNGDLAKVVLGFGEPEAHINWTRTVILERIEDRWKIIPDPVDEGPLTAAQTANSFYNWYLNYAQGGPEFRNPLADKAYQTAPHLSRGLVNQIDQLGARPEGFVADPFLCAQDIPDLRVETSFYNNARPVVLVSTSFGTFLTADLVRADFNRWEITRITCGGHPPGIVKAFYTWALGYMTESGEMRNPWVEGAHNYSGFLTQRFIDVLNEQLNSGKPLSVDPVILAQDLPVAFQVSPCSYPECALVNLQFGDVTVRQLKVTVEMQNGQLRIASVSQPPASEIPQPDKTVPGVERWWPYTDEQYGLAFRYPSKCQPVGLNVNDLHTPEEYPVMRTVHFRIHEDEGLQANYRIEVILGDEQAIEATNPSTETGEAILANGNTGKIWKDESGAESIVFQHPSRQGVWVVFHNLGRNRSDPVFNAMLSTLVLLP